MESIVLDLVATAPVSTGPLPSNRSNSVRFMPSDRTTHSQLSPKNICRLAVNRIVACEEIVFGHT